MLCWLAWCRVLTLNQVQLMEQLCRWQTTEEAAAVVTKLQLKMQLAFRRDTPQMRAALVSLLCDYASMDPVMTVAHVLEDAAQSPPGGDTGSKCEAAGCEEAMGARRLFAMCCLHELHAQELNKLGDKYAALDRVPLLQR